MSTSSKENSTKMKGLLKGLRYISQMFDDNNKDRDMQIGFPTDVKHVAHIGWDGPATASSPSWMNEFQAAPGSSGPLNQDGEMAEDSSRKGSKGPPKSPGHEPSEVSTKSSRSRSSRGDEKGGTDSPKREKSDKSKQSRRSSRRASTENIARTGSQESLEAAGRESSAPDIPKKSRRKKLKEGSGSGGSKKSKDPRTSSAKGNSIVEELPQNSFQEGEDKGFT